MNHYSTLGCFYIAGTYNGGESIIGYNNGQLKGQWLTRSRTNFTGNVRADCKGEVTFPDDKNNTFEFQFDKVLNKIFWKSRTNGKVWTKGNLLIFVKILVEIYHKNGFYMVRILHSANGNI